MAPFPLITHADVSKRGRQIAEVTGSGFMPPWLPAPGVNHFVGDRSLEAEEIETIRRWVAAGAPEGDADDLPPRPSFPAGWQIGEPDLVLEMPRAYELPAEGRDVYRNFVIPVAVSETRWVRAVEFQPDNRFVVHHALLFVDTSGEARLMEAEDPEPGYAGMGPGRGRIPDGQLIAWAPGKFPRAGHADIAWRLDERTDVILQLHLRPTGRAEEVQVALGLHFSGEPPTRHPQTIRLVSRDIDIPAGEPAYLVEDRFVLPVDVRVLAVYPHAHYLGKEMRGYAVLPDGTRRWLIHIRAWDFNWQDEYTYAEPIDLPAGSVLTMEYIFDNSADNPLNPNSPPRRVVHGGASDDEMAELILQVLPAEEDRPILLREFAAKERAVNLAYVERMAVEEPGDPYWHSLAGSYRLSAGDARRAIEHYERAVELKPGEVNPLFNLARAKMTVESEASAELFARVLEIDPGHLAARVELGRLRLIQGREDEALSIFQDALDVDPGNARIHCFVGEILAGRGDTAAAMEHFEAGLASNPDHRRTLRNYGWILIRRGRYEDVVEVIGRAAELYPTEAWPVDILGRAHLQLGALRDALRCFETAQRLEPAQPSHAANVSDVRARLDG